jgi:hypothetical protein
MTTYLYLFDGTDETIEVNQRMSEPALAQIDGRKVSRIICPPQLCGVERKTWGYPYVSNALPTTIKGCKMVQQKNKNGSLSRPKPLIESRRHEREVMARNDLVRSEE